MKRILIVDDELDVLKVVHFRLIKMGYEVVIAENGQEGLDKARELKPDLILMDLSMPFIRGDELCRRIKADPATQHIPVIIMTASIKGAADDLTATGADEKILKPFDPEDLAEKIKKLIN
ncbi:MAG: CheY-like chemotaxis protein [Candidatus Omnitrophota bacterium]|jgi:CheY-like chemotaxis protein